MKLKKFSCRKIIVSIVIPVIIFSFTEMTVTDIKAKGINKDVHLTNMVNTASTIVNNEQGKLQPLKMVPNGDAVGCKGTGGKFVEFAPGDKGLEAGKYPFNKKSIKTSDDITYNFVSDNFKGNDCIKIEPRKSRKMELDTIGCYDKVYILATAGGVSPDAPATFSVTLNYTDNTTQQEEYKLYDWCMNKDPNDAGATKGFNRYNDNGTVDNSTKGRVRLYSKSIDADGLRLLKSIEFNNASDKIYCAIFAVTGQIEIGAPDAPEGLEAHREKDKQNKEKFLGTWSEVSGATSYYVDVAIDESFTNILAKYNNIKVDGNRIDVIGLEKAEVYYFRVRASNEKGQSISSATYKVEELPLVLPDVPKNLDSIREKGEFKGIWSKVDNATSYYVDVAIDEHFTNILSEYKNKEVDVTSINVTGLNDDVTYYYRVKSRNEDGESEYSATYKVDKLIPPITGGIPVPPVPPVPKNLKADRKEGKFEASWSEVKDATSYYIDVATDENFTNILIGYDNTKVTTSAGIKITGLDDDVTYYYRVKSSNEDGESEYSDIYKVNKLIPPITGGIPVPPVPQVLLAPENLRADRKEGKFEASWSEVKDATSYYIDVATDESFTNILSEYKNKKVYDTSMNITGLDDTVTYYYRVRTGNSSGLSDSSEVYIVKINQEENKPPAELNKPDEEKDDEGKAEVNKPEVSKPDTNISGDVEQPDNQNTSTYEPTYRNPNSTDSSIQYYQIKIEKPKNGTIIFDSTNKDGDSLASKNSNKVLQIIPDNGYKIKNVIIDGKLVGSINKYEFKGIIEDHTIEVEFERDTTIYIPLELNKVDHFAYMYGVNANKFEPDRDMTRAEAIAMFSRLLLKTMNTDTAYLESFIDINGNEWYANTVGYMETEGVIKNIEGNFRANKPITRAEFMALASRFEEIISDKKVSFRDISDEFWAEKYINSGVAKGWIVGYEDETFRPNKSITRAEVVVIVNVILERSGDKHYADENHQMLNKFVDISQDHWAYYEIIEATNGHDYSMKENSETWKHLK